MSSRALVLSLLASLVLTGAALLMVFGFPTFLLFAAACALVGVIYLMWMSLQGMGEKGQMSFEEALSFAAPTAAEEQKRAVLRTLKDLEYELHVGKISQSDYDEVSAEVRARAKLMIAQGDALMKESLEKVEAELVEYERAHPSLLGETEKATSELSPPSEDEDDDEEASPPGSEREPLTDKATANKNSSAEKASSEKNSEGVDS